MIPDLLIEKCLLNYKEWESWQDQDKPIKIDGGFFSYIVEKSLSDVYGDVLAQTREEDFARHFFSKISLEMFHLICDGWVSIDMDADEFIKIISDSLKIYNKDPHNEKLKLYFPVLWRPTDMKTHPSVFGLIESESKKT